MKSIIYWAFSTFLIIFIFGAFLLIGLNIYESGTSFSQVWSWLFILLGIALEVGASHRLQGFWHSVVNRPNEEEPSEQDHDAVANFDGGFLMLRILGVSLMIGGIIYNVTSWNGVLVWSFVIPMLLFRLLFVKKSDGSSEAG